MHSLNTSPQEEIYTVSQLNSQVRYLLETSFSRIWLMGEISNVSRPSSGHIYFSLKDHQAQVRCALFRNSAQSITFPVENGQQVIVLARISLYEARGDYQLIIDHIQLAGAGLLQLAFDEMKKKLAKEGLFDAKHKKALPRFPNRIGIITSSSGAAISDILTVLKRRFPFIPVILYPCSVQGKEAAAQIVAAIEIANHRQECDVLILARGGGPMEDLWCFNEEKVARAIFASLIPLVTGIGHEIDFTIADFVADLRAPTPSAAAECVSPHQQECQQILQRWQQQFIQLITAILQQTEWHLHHLQKRLRHPRDRLLEQMQHVDHLEKQIRLLLKNIIYRHYQHLKTLQLKFFQSSPTTKTKHLHLLIANQQVRLSQAMPYYLKYRQQQLHNIAQNLIALSPLKTLERGYAIATNPQTHKIISQAAQLNIHEKIELRFSDDVVQCDVTYVPNAQ